MTFERDWTIKIRNLFDEIVPPVLRDQYWFMLLPFKIVTGDKADLFMHFKERANGLSDKAFSAVYTQIHKSAMQRETDLNRKCFQKILKSVKGKTVLEVGCGKGLLAKALSRQYQVTA